MANTKEAVNLLGQDWENINTLTGIPVGAAMSIQNLSRERVLLAISAAKPSQDFIGSIIAPDPRYIGYVSVNEDTVWLKGEGLVSVQEA